MVQDGRWSLPIAAFALFLLAPATPARAQLWNWKSLDHVNAHLHGQVVDHTHNHGQDLRIPSAILGTSRDLYVYLPPGYDPRRAYPVILYLHMGFVDEHAFIGLRQLRQVDQMMADGAFPPAIIACPDGMIDGQNKGGNLHSGYMNGVYGRFEDHLMAEVLPFLHGRYSIRPERQAHALLGTSAGGFAALSIALRHRDYFGTVAALAPPANTRYDTTNGYYKQKFDPSTYRWRTSYDPDEIVGSFYFGLQRVRASKYIRPIFGDDPGVIQRVAAVNPGDLLFTTNLQPGELNIYINYPANDNWNFDSQAESFAWLAAQRGIAVDVHRVRLERHSLHYFQSQHAPTYAWLSSHILPPTP